ncbi:FAD-dependent monooxygenase [Ilumatobacter sp.]|uniref:FAD-dependent monooxygenase n=1 Tax=Ilumatobacter sp. TaxID=1967498 RepID=UPI003AF58CF7
MAGDSNEGVAVDVDVLIVGAGPVGMLGAILASRHGLNALVVERRDGPQTAPAAHVVNARTYEICRQAGLDMERIHAAGKSEADAGHVNFVTRLAGDLIGRLPFERQGDACLAYTPTPLRNLSQHRFEPILADELRASDGAELRYRHQWEHSEEVGDAVISDVSDLDTGETIRVRSRYVIGCDGAGSRVRKLLGIEMVGPPLLQCYLMIHFAANLRELTAERPAVLHFVLDPEAGGAFIAHDVESDWVFMHAIDPSIESVEDYSDERCREVIDNAAGTTLDAEILGKGTWWMSSQTADSMGRGRIFLAGDSAHRFPPTGGLGLNSGVQDIHGLMWRIGAIVAGRAKPALLETYEAERIPVAQNNAHQSLTNAIKLVELPATLGTDAEPTSKRLRASLADPAKADAIAAAVELQREHFDLFGLQLGYVYDQGALVPEDQPAELDSPSEYEPTARPGARLPHAWLDETGGRSALDLIPIDRPVLFSFGAHDTWERALGEPDTDADVVTVRIGVDTPVLDAWRDLCELEETGALLVRPDHHVAWRARSIDQASDLARAIDVVTGHTNRQD